MGSWLFSTISRRVGTCVVRRSSLAFEMQKRSKSLGGPMLASSLILKTKPYDRTQCTRQSHMLISNTNSLQPQAQPVLWNANFPQMISHFLGFSQTLILKRGHIFQEIRQFSLNFSWKWVSTGRLDTLGEIYVCYPGRRGRGILPYMSYTAMCQTRLPSSFFHWAKQKKSIPILTIVVWNRVANSVCLGKV